MNSRRCPGPVVRLAPRPTPFAVETFAAVLIAGTLSACGGGGGSDGDPVVVEIPLRSLNASNAEAIARLTVDMMAATDVLTETFGLGSGVNSSYCQSGSGIGTVTNCVIGNNTFSGSASSTIRTTKSVTLPGTDSPRDMPLRLDTAINSLTWQSTASPTTYELNGNLTTNYTYPINSIGVSAAATTGTLTFTDTQSRARLQFRGLNQRYNLGPHESVDGYAFEHVDQSGGIYFMDENLAYTLSGGSLLNPFEELLIVGDGARLAMRYPSDTLYQLDLDADNDGNYDTFATMPRSELGRGHTQSTAAPTLALTVRGNNGAPIPQRIPVVLVASASDADYNFLTFSWTVTSAPAGVTDEERAQLLATANLRTENAAFKADKPGEYVISATVNEVNTSNPQSTTAQITVRVAFDAPQFDVSNLDGATGVVGVTQTFPITQTDPEGSITAELLVAPAGMTLAYNSSEARYELSWTPASQFFAGISENVVVKFSNEDHDTVRNFTVHVDDSGAAAPLVTPGLTLNTFSSGATLLNLDDNATNELLIASNGSHFIGYDLAGSAPSSVLTNPFQLGIDATALTGIKPLRQNGSVSAYVATNARGVFLVDKNTLEVISSRSLQFNLTALTSKRRFDVADLDGDGNDEIIVLTKTVSSTLKDQLYVLNPNLTTRVVTEQRDLGQEFLLGNVDTDSAIEIVCGNGLVLSLNDTTLATDVAADALFGDRNFVLADVDADGRDEVVESNSGDLRVIDVDTQATTLIPIVTNADNLNLFALNADGDGAEELAIGSLNNVVQIFSIDKSTPAATLDRSIGTATSAVNVLEVLAGDVRGDSSNEIIVVARKDSGAPLISVASLDGTLLVDGANTSIATGDFVSAKSIDNTAATSIATAAIGTGGAATINTLSFADTGNAAISSPIFSADAARFAVAADVDSDTTLDIVGNSVSDGDTAASIIVGAPGDTPWQLPITAGTPAPISVAQINGSGNLDAVFIERSGTVGSEVLDLVVHEIVGAEVARINIQSAGLVASQPVAIAVANLDGDADPDIVVLNETALHTFEFSGGSLSLTSTIAISDSAIALATGDIDGNGTDEIAVARNGLFENAVSIYSGSLSLITQSAVTDDTTALSLYVASSERALLLLASTNAANSSNKISALDANSLTEAWQSPLLGGVINSLQVLARNDGDLLEVGTASAFYRIKR